MHKGVGCALVIKVLHCAWHEYWAVFCSSWFVHVAFSRARDRTRKYVTQGFEELTALPREGWEAHHVHAGVGN